MQQSHHFLLGVHLAKHGARVVACCLQCTHRCSVSAVRVEGAVIFITNVKFDAVKSKKLQDHLSALMSRCHYIDLTIDSIADKMLRIKQVIRLGMLNGYNFEDTRKVEDMIIDYMETNGKRLNEISLRMAIKLAELIKMREATWQDVANVTCLKRGI